MKFVVILLLCLPAVLLARPNDESQSSSSLVTVQNSLQGRISKRSAESSEESASGSSEQSTDVTGINFTEVIGKMAKDLAGIKTAHELREYLLRFLGSTSPLGIWLKALSIENIVRVLDSINPLTRVLRDLPFIGNLFSVAQQLLDIPLAVFSNILALMLTAAARLMRTLRSGFPLAI